MSLIENIQSHKKNIQILEQLKANYDPAAGLSLGIQIKGEWVDLSGTSNELAIIDLLIKSQKELLEIQLSLGRLYLKELNDVIKE